jgi:hypothetical protein
MISINLIDHEKLKTNNLLGTFSVDVSYIYKYNKYHEIYRVWVPMTDPLDQSQTPYGFVKLSINILGPKDKPPVHNSETD